MFIHTACDTRKTTQRAATAQRRAHNCAQGRAQLAHNSAHNPPPAHNPPEPETTERLRAHQHEVPHTHAACGMPECLNTAPAQCSSPQSLHTRPAHKVCAQGLRTRPRTTQDSLMRTRKAHKADT